MSSLVMELGYNEILSAEMAVSLRNYITSRNPSLSSYIRAEIFADAVNRIVESRLPKFGLEMVKRLKELLFRDIAGKPSFSVDCGDVFKAAVGMKTLGHEFFRELNEWISGLLKKPVVRESLFDLVFRAHRLMDSRPEDAISDILALAEQAAGRLRYAAAEPARTFAEAAAIAAGAGYGGQPACGKDASLCAGADGCAAVYTSCDAAAKRSGLQDILKGVFLSIPPARVAATSALAAAALAFMLYAGCKPAAAPAADPGYAGIRIGGAVVTGMSGVDAYSFSRPVLTRYLIENAVVKAAAGNLSERTALAADTESAVAGGDLADSGKPSAISGRPSAALYQADRPFKQAPAQNTPAGLKTRSIRMRATAYDLSKESCGKSPGHPEYGVTNSGTRATAGRTVAVDPRVIPLGTRLLISFPPEYGGLDGVYVAEDTGRLIKGDSIDIFFGEDRDGSREIYESVMKFGVRYVDVRVLD